MYLGTYTTLGIGLNILTIESTSTSSKSIVSDVIIPKIPSSSWISNSYEFFILSNYPSKALIITRR